MIEIGGPFKTQKFPNRCCQNLHVHFNSRESCFSDFLFWLCQYLFKILSSKNYPRNVESFYKTGQTFWVESRLTTGYICYVDREIGVPD